jgi:hypothetical protein
MLMRSEPLVGFDRATEEILSERLAVPNGIEASHLGSLAQAVEAASSTG